MQRKEGETGDIAVCCPFPCCMGAPHSCRSEVPHLQLCICQRRVNQHKSSVNSRGCWVACSIVTGVHAGQPPDMCADGQLSLAAAALSTSNGN
jgi:hypothetical protein